MPVLTLSQSKDLTMFFSKLLGEVRHLEASKVIFQPQNDSLAVKLYKDNSEVRTLSIQLNWFELIWAWVAERVSYLDLSKRPLKLQIPKKLRPNQLLQQIAVRISTDVVTFSAALDTQLKGSRAMTLSEFKVVGLSEVQEMFRITGTSSFPRFEGPGLIVFSSPKADQLAIAMGTFMSLLSDPISTLNWEEGENAGHALLVIGIVSDDPYHALMNARPHLSKLKQAKCIGLVGLGFAKQVCQGCARETPMDQKLIDPLPDILRTNLPSSYLVGRGCEICGHTGFDGFVSILNAVELEGGLVPSFENLTTVQYLFSRGYKPLLCEGLEKIKVGKTTLQSLYEITKSIPETALEVLKEQKTNQTRKSEKSSTKVQGKGRKKPLLMVVEDDTDQCAILEMVFKSAGYDILFANDGLQALALLKNNIPDLVVTDLMMPNLDGRELVARMKIDSKLREIPVLILTVISDSDKEYDLLDLGADDYCEKTVQRKVLLKRVENILKRQ